MQAAFQANCDSGVSKTINLPESATIEDVRIAYELAYKLQCKGITVYRDGSRPEQVLSVKKTDKKEKVAYHRPRIIPSTTEKIDSSLGRLYLTTGYSVDDNVPVEVFLQIGKSGADIHALCEGIGRLISLALQNGISPNKVGSRLRGIQGEEKVVVDNKKYASILDLIGKRLEAVHKEKLEEDKEERSLMMCPDCDMRIYRIENCYKCMSCGWSKC
jgi:ribonucleoside-diphosphate reductase alpha chain